MEKLMITVAPTGSLPTKKMTPHVPINPEQIIEMGRDVASSDEARQILRL